MWNVSDGKYSNVYYGANFVNQIGHGNPELVMVRPVNGSYYETFIYSQYFTTVVDGIVAKQDATLTAIDAINNLPKEITLEDEYVVIKARELYDLAAAVDDQKALITNYSTLVSAENTILALKSLEEDTETPDDTITEEDGTEDEESDKNEEEKDDNTGFIVAIAVVSSIGVVLLIVLVVAIALIVTSIRTQTSISVIFATFIMKRMQKRLLKKLEKQAKKMQKEQIKATKKAEKAEKKANKKSKKASKEDVVVEATEGSFETNENE